MPNDSNGKIPVFKQRSEDLIIIKKNKTKQKLQMKFFALVALLGTVASLRLTQHGHGIRNALS